MTQEQTSTQTMVPVEHHYALYQRDTPDANTGTVVNRICWNGTDPWEPPAGFSVIADPKHQYPIGAHYPSEARSLPATSEAPSVLYRDAGLALQAARQTVMYQFIMLNEPIPDPWIQYQKALMAILDRSQTPGELPKAPVL